MAESTHMTLLLRLRDRNDSLGWAEFDERYSELLYRYARGKGAKHETAEDVVQEVTMYLFKAMQGFEYDARKGRFRSYLRSAVIHALGRRATKEAKQPDPIDPQAFDYLGVEKETSEDARWEREWQMHRLRWALKSIADEFEEKTLKAFEVHALSGLSVSETAQQVGISTASVYQAKSRILKRVKEMLNTMDPDEDV